MNPIAGDDEQEHGTRLLLSGKGTVLAHRLARPLAAESDDDQQSWREAPAQSGRTNALAGAGKRALSRVSLLCQLIDVLMA